MANTFKAADRREKSHYAERVTIIVVVFYTVFETIYGYIILNDPVYGMVRLASGLLLAGCAAVLFRLSFRGRLTRHKTAWLAPALFLLTETALAIYFGGDSLYFWFFIGCSLMCLTFLDRRALLIQAGLANLLTVPLVYGAGIRLLGERYDLAHHTIQLLAYNLANALIFSVCAFSVGKFRGYESTWEYFDTLMETTPNYLVVINERARIEYISRSLSEWFGLSHREYALNRPIFDLCQASGLRMIFQEVMEGGGDMEKTFELVLEEKKYWFILRSYRTGSGKIARTFEFTDITPIMEAKNEAEAATKAKSSFLANMSHEIRTPMNAIMGFTELIMLGRLDTEQRTHAEAIKGASQSLLDIINDILDFSKLDAQKMEIFLKPFDIVSLINDTVNIINVKAAASGIAFTAFISKDIPPRVNGDELRMKQALINILNNAVKFTRQGCVSLRVFAETTPDGSLKLCFAVTDTGTGIKKADMEKLFGAFEQLDTRRNQNIVGTGLGLAITKRLVELMGGAICVSSVYGKGSTFSFYVICPGVHTGRIASLPEPRTYRVLCYDPVAYHAEVLRDALESLQAGCVICGELSQFKEQLFSGQFTHVFFDKEALPFVKNFLTREKTSFILMKEVYDTVVADDAVVQINRPLLITGIMRLLKNSYASETPGTHTDQIKVGAFTTKDAVVLLVDDNRVNLMVAEGLLQRYGIRVVMANSGEESLDMVKQEDFDIIFMDHMMPGMDGIDAAKAIRALGGRFEKIPIIALTANAVVGAKTQFMEAGMNDFLSKPIVIQSLHNLLLAHLPAEKVIKESRPPS